MPNSPLIIGIDPGKTGGVACLHIDGTIHSVLPMPTMDALSDLIDTLKPEMVYLEKSQAMPGQGVCSMFSYGEHYGKIQGILIALLQAYHLVAPVTWTKKMHVGCSGADSKAKSLEVVKRRWPVQNLLATPRCKKPHLGITDALLIAEYGRVYVRGTVSPLPSVAS